MQRSFQFANSVLVLSWDPVDQSRLLSVGRDAVRVESGEELELSRVTRRLWRVAVAGDDRRKARRRLRCEWPRRRLRPRRPLPRPREVSESGRGIERRPLHWRGLAPLQLPPSARRHGRRRRRVAQDPRPPLEALALKPRRVLRRDLRLERLDRVEALHCWWCRQHRRARCRVRCCRARSRAGGWCWCWWCRRRHARGRWVFCVVLGTGIDRSAGATTHRTSGGVVMLRRKRGQRVSRHSREIQAGSCAPCEELRRLGVLRAYLRDARGRSKLGRHR